MDGHGLWEVRWRIDGDELRAFEPTTGEVAGAAPRLAADYNDMHNRRMMAHDDDLSAEDVASYYDELRSDGGRPFLLERGGELMGDADLRNIEGEMGEFAILIGARETQGRGLGTRYAVMVHSFAFRVMDLARLYVSIIPENAASRRLFEKLGYRLDDSDEARELVDDDSDVTMSIERGAFEAAWSGALGEIALARRPAR
jgi:RimJ/RimL family protein N-acetyltransferase